MKLPSPSPRRFAPVLSLLALTVGMSVALTAAAQAAPAAPASSFWPPPPWLVAIAWPLVTGAASLLYGLADRNPMLHGWLSLIASLGLDLPKLLAMLQQALTGQVKPVGSRQAKMPEPVVPSRGFAVGELLYGLAVLALASCLVVFACGCASAPPVVPVTPDNAQPIADCQSIDQLSTLFVDGDYVFTGGAAAMGVVGAALPSSNASGKTDLAVGAAASAGVAGVLTGLVALERGKFASGQCQQYLGPLPITPFGNKAATP